MKKIEIYTDGSCIGNPGPGGWASILIYGNHQKILQGSEEHTTNNRMELTAVIESLEALKEPCNIIIYSDSQYVIKAMGHGWLDKWRENGWRSGKGKVANIDLWKRLLGATKDHQITWSKVRSHASNPFNNKCDAIAKAAAYSTGDRRSPESP